MFVLNVDLWDDKGQRELNLVRNTGTSPSISAGVTVSYAQTEAAHLAYSSIMPQNSIMKFEQNPGQGYNPYPAPPNVNPYSQPAPYPTQYQHNYPPQNGNQYPPQNGYSQPSPGGYYSSSGGMHTPIAADYPPPSQQQYSARSYSQPDIAHQQPPRMAQNNGTPQGMFTRNLIGSLAASAFRLTDPDDRIGIWFVLQDLSVRTEGNFRYFSHCHNLLSPQLTTISDYVSPSSTWDFPPRPQTPYQAAPSPAQASTKAKPPSSHPVSPRNSASSLPKSSPVWSKVHHSVNVLLLKESKFPFERKDLVIKVEKTMSMMIDCD